NGYCDTILISYFNPAVYPALPKFPLALVSRSQSALRLGIDCRNFGVRLGNGENVAPTKKWIARQQLGENALDERKIGGRIHGPAQTGKVTRKAQRVEQENLRVAVDIGSHMLAVKRVLRFARRARQSGHRHHLDVQ